jgi:HK97 family phage major capsid protein
MNIDELILSIEVERDQAIKRRDRAIATIKQMLAKAKQDGRASFTAEEDADVKNEFAKREQAMEDLKGINARLEDARQVKRAEQEVNEQLEQRSQDVQTAAAQKPAYDRVARVGNEERTYNQGNCRRGSLFVRDVIKQFLHRDLEAEQRLIRHMQEERVERGVQLERAVGTGAFTGLVVPQYLTELYAPATAALRPFADICNQHDLPDNGMTVNISRITTPSGVALQATENTAVQNTDMDDTLLTENVQTAAGQQTISRQAIERGTGVEDIVMDDLFRRYATALDATLLNQATTGLSAVAAATTYTDTTPTGPELWPKLLGAAASAEAALLGFAQPDVAVMHSRRWYWLQSQLTTSFPMFSQPGIPGNQAGTNAAQRYGAGVRGVLPNGMVAIVDNNIATNLGAGTNEDEIYVVSSDECHLWEDPNAPVFIRAEQPAAASLGVLLVLYGYFAYSFRRFPAAVGKITGTGLVAPAF